MSVSRYDCVRGPYTVSVSRPPTGGEGHTYTGVSGSVSDTVDTLDRGVVRGCRGTQAQQPGSRRPWRPRLVALAQLPQRIEHARLGDGPEVRDISWRWPGFRPGISSRSALGGEIIAMASGCVPDGARRQARRLLGAGGER
jgi:hypothetical protein